jgi:transposase
MLFASANHRAGLNLLFAPQQKAVEAEIAQPGVEQFASRPPLLRRVCLPRSPYGRAMRRSPALFDDLPTSEGRRAAKLGRARMREPVRDEVRFDVCDLDGLLEEDHPARLIWAYASRVDLSDFEAAVKAREGGRGMAQTSPHLMLALWLYATTRGVGGARESASRCESEAAFRWLSGGELQSSSVVGISRRLEEQKVLAGLRVGATH